MKPILIAITLVLLFSCKKDPTNKEKNTITVALNNCSSEETGAAAYQLCFDSLLDDSRCPKNVVCVWQGVAHGKFRFIVNNQQHVVKLATANFAPTFYTDTTVAGYHLKLINILPYPEYPNNPPGPITATVEITQ